VSPAPDGSKKLREMPKRVAAGTIHFAYAASGEVDRACHTTHVIRDAQDVELFYNINLRESVIVGGPLVAFLMRIFVDKAFKHSHEDDSQI
jgi:hypothetical protein